MSALTALPPATAAVLLAVGVLALPRRVGHTAAVLGMVGTSWWIATVPSGLFLETTLFGFEAVLFNVDAYARLLGIALGVIAAVGTGYLYATGADRRQTAYALVYLGAGLGAVFAGDWLSLVVFWELMAVAATVLIWHRTADRRSGIRYAIYHEIGGIFLMGGVLIHYDRVGTFLYGDGITAGLAAVLVGLGIGLNCGLLGLHVWLVDTYPRTHVATSVVLAAVTTKVGAYTIVRAFPQGNAWIAYAGGAMVLFGVTFAILQSDIRRLLSYHIISQVGYMVAGFGAGTALANAGAIGHLVNNILYKSLLFMVAGVVIQRTGRENLKQLGGLVRAMPVAAVVFLVGALSIAGIPGFNGFVSKGMVIDGVEQAGFEVLWAVLIVGGVGTVISFAKLGYAVFLGGAKPDQSIADLGVLEAVTLGSVAGLCLVIGVVPAVLFGLLPADGVAAAKPFAPKQFQKTGAVTAVGLVGFILLRSRLARVSPVPDLDAVYHPLGRRVQATGVAMAVGVEVWIDRVGHRAEGVLTRRLAGESLLNWDPPIGVWREQSPIGLGVLALVVVLTLLLVVAAL